MRYGALVLALLMLALPARAQEESVPDVGAMLERAQQEAQEAPPAATEEEEKPAQAPPAENAAEDASEEKAGDAAAAPKVTEDDLPPVEPPPPAEMEDRQVAVLRTIDKLSARTHTFEIPVGKTVKFGTSLFIKARACRSASPLAQPENAAFLQIWERKPDEAESYWIFSGWMFSSSPSVSAMDHPVYDVWVIACKNKAASSKGESFSSEAEPASAPEDSPTDGKKQTGDDTAPAAEAEETITDD